MPNILVLNPNSSTAMTQEIAASLEAASQTSGVTIRCETNDAGPRGIETDEDVVSAGRNVVELLKEADAQAVVIACFSDPGVTAARQAFTIPIFGIAESAYRQAIERTGSFGVISIVQASIARHARHLETLGLLGHLRGDRSLDLGVAASGTPEAFPRMVEIGSLLRDEDGASAIILGCAGMGVHRERLKDALGITVIDPVLAAVQDAIQRLN